MSGDLIFCLQRHQQFIMNLQLPNSLQWSPRNMDLFLTLKIAKWAGELGTIFHFYLAPSLQSAKLPTALVDDFIEGLV